jgi:hypothetical protein
MVFLSSIEASGSNISQAVCQVLCCCNKNGGGGCTVEWKERRMKEDFEKTTL